MFSGIVGKNYRLMELLRTPLPLLFYHKKLNYLKRNILLSGCRSLWISEVSPIEFRCEIFIGLRGDQVYQLGNYLPYQLHPLHVSLWRHFLMTA